MYAVAAQNFEYKMSNILDKPLCVSLNFLRCLHSFSAEESRYLVISLSSLVPSVPTGILLYKTIRMA